MAQLTDSTKIETYLCVSSAIATEIAKRLRLAVSGAGVPAGGLQQHIPLSGTAGKYNNAAWVFQDPFNNRTIYAEVDDSLPTGAPGTSIALYIRRSDTSAKQELNGRFRLRLFY